MVKSSVEKKYMLNDFTVI